MCLTELDSVSSVDEVGRVRMLSFLMHDETGDLALDCFDLLPQLQNGSSSHVMAVVLVQYFCGDG